MAFRDKFLEIMIYILKGQDDGYLKILYITKGSISIVFSSPSYQASNRFIFCGLIHRMPFAQTGNLIHILLEIGVTNEFNNGYS
jgi:hypothetical protein